MTFASALHDGPTLCRHFVPPSRFADLYAALVCGVNLRDGAAKTLFVDTGLIHILVVSGAHLGVIDRGCRQLPAKLRVACLVGYAWLTDFGAPIVRALVGRGVVRLTGPRGSSVLQTEFLTSLAIVCAYPPWITSRSFLMSWLCVLALKAPSPRTRFPTLGESVRCYLLLYPFSLSAPLTIAWNCVVAPAIGRVMFPLCLATMIVWPLTVVTDRTWDYLLRVLELGPHAPPEGAMIATAWLWWLPWIVNLGLMYGEFRWRRARSFV